MARRAFMGARCWALQRPPIRVEERVRWGSLVTQSGVFMMFIFSHGDVSQQARTEEPCGGGENGYNDRFKDEMCDEYLVGEIVCNSEGWTLVNASLVPLVAQDRNAGQV